MRPDDGGSGRPPLPAEAGPTERTLYDVYDFQTGIVELTAGDWATTAESVRGLSGDVRGIVNALQGAPDAWSGPAADAAYETLGRLATSLDVHAEKIDRIEAGLTSAYDSATAARSDYVTKVRSVSLVVDQAAFRRAPARQPAQASPDLPPVLDRQAYDQAVAGAQAARERQAAAVLATFTDSMTTAAKKLPVDPADQTPVRDGSSTPAGGGGGTGGGSRPGGSSYLPPGGGGDPTTGQVTLQPTDGGGVVTGGTHTTPVPQQPVGDPRTPVLDGPVDGTTGPGGTSAVGPVPGSTGVGAPGGQVGAGGAAAGVGGMVAGGGAAAMLGRGRMPGGGAAGRLPGSMVAGGAGGAGGSAGRTGASGSASGAGRSSVVAGGGQGGSARGASARGGTGSRSNGRTGRYGVPKLGERAGGRGVAGAAGGAGGAGGRGAKRDRRDGQPVDHLTSQDEEAWFEGAEDATPPVWE
jgi:hypothetical protein